MMNCIKYIFVSVTTLYLIPLSISQKDAKLCRLQRTCGACIAASPDCAWCFQEGFSKNQQPCDVIKNLLSHNCESSKIFTPTISMDQPGNTKLRDGSASIDAVQIQPQNVTIKIRPKKAETVNLKFRLADNYPVDLYYLMDLSNSMADDKAKLATLGKDIALEMNDITEDFRLGFGSFVDKVTMPYVSTIEKDLKSPCKNCVPPYSFKHQLTLDKNPNKFEKKVRNASISGNLDAPESGFDAIIQAIACDRIGWRKKSRRMLLFSTDASSHFAGDGKLGGIITPNDGACHLDAEGYYSKSLEQDYPSISQIAAKVSEKKVNVIFAVTSQQFDLYKRLSNYVEGSSVGQLSNDSSNIVTLVRKNYDTITSQVELNVKKPDGVKVTLKTRCLNKNGELKETNMCEGLKITDQVTFEVSIEVEGCPANRSKWSQDIEISAVGLNEALGIKLELQCECDCEKPGKSVNASDICSNRGVYVCGICDCWEGYTGKTCQCGGSDKDDAEFEKDCIKPDSKNQNVCTGRGKCHCGECICKAIKTIPGIGEVYYLGKYCDCDNYGCPYSANGLMCGGPEHGKCNCGKCDCEPGWSEDSCYCTTNNATCIARSGILCDGYGDCKCGKCDCWKTEQYTGASCEECATCGGGAHCRSSEKCVQCKVFKTGDYSKEECDAKCPEMETIDRDIVNSNNEDEVVCSFPDQDDCRIYFKYTYLTNGTLFYVVSTKKQCPEPVNVLAIVLGVIGGIVLLGLLILLIWKLITVIQDRREYAKFQEFNENAKWDTEENPIYKEATSTFKNPTYQAKG